MADDPFESTRMTLGEHLEELRSRLFKGLVALGLAFLAAWFFRDAIAEVVIRPYDQAMEMLERHWVEEAEGLLAEDPERERIEFFVTADPADKRLKSFDKEPVWLAPGEYFFFVLRICLYAALVVGAPILLWQLWQFIAAGLYARERRAVLGYFPISVLMFLAGVLFGYFVMVPYAMYFLNQSPIEFGRPNISVERYLTFISGLCLAFGVIFQLPLILTFLGGTGLLPPATMSKYRGHFIVGAFVVAAVLTPPDPITQMMMGIPMVVLYELGVVGARLASRSRAGRAGAPGTAGSPGSTGGRGSATEGEA